MTRTARIARARPTGCIVLTLAAVLVFVQVLGLTHGVLHDQARTDAQAFADAGPLGQPADASVFDGLFSEHDSEADCDRFDHITHADPAWFDAPQFALQAAEGNQVAVHAGWHIAPQAAGFLARGPPPQA